MNAPFRYRLTPDVGTLYRGQARAVSSTGIAFVPTRPSEVTGGENLYLQLPALGGAEHREVVAEVVEPTGGQEFYLARTSSSQATASGRLDSALIPFLAKHTWGVAAKLKARRPFAARTVTSAEDYLKAARLLYREYLARGYCEERPDSLYFNHYALLPDSRTYIVERGASLLGTMSLVPDSPLGLPCESVYREEVAKLRGAGRKLAELSLVALNGDYGDLKRSYLLADPKKFVLFVELLKALLDDVRAQGITDVVVATHPNNGPTYRFLLFEDTGPLRSYQGACDNPALLFHADLRIIRQTQAIPRYVSPPQMNAGIAAYLYHYGSSYGAGVTGDVVRRLLRHSNPSAQKHMAGYIQGVLPGECLPQQARVTAA